MICRINQWTGFDMMGTSVMKEVRLHVDSHLHHYVHTSSKNCFFSLSSVMTLFASFLSIPLYFSMSSINKLVTSRPICLASLNSRTKYKYYWKQNYKIKLLLISTTWASISQFKIHKYYLPFVAFEPQKIWQIKKYSCSGPPAFRSGSCRLRFS